MDQRLNIKKRNMMTSERSENKFHECIYYVISGFPICPTFSRKNCHFIWKICWHQEVQRWAKTQICYKTQIYIYIYINWQSTLTKLLKRREIFVVLINFCFFFINIYLKYKYIQKYLTTKSADSVLNTTLIQR